MTQYSASAHFARLFVVFGAITLIVGLLCLLVLFGRRYLGLGRGDGWLLCIAVIAAAIGTGFYVGFHLPRSTGSEEGLTRILCAGLLVLFGIPLVLKVYRAWIGVYVTEAEKLPGTPGIRAWLSPANMILALITSLCACYGFGYPFFAIFALSVIILLTYPIGNSMTQNTTPPQSPLKQETLTSERERVLSLLDAGKITAEESAELLNALAATVQSSERGAAAGGTRAIRSHPGQRMVLIGAALVLVGFFLPWFSVNPAKELERMTGQMGFGNIIPQFSSQSGMQSSSGGNGSTFGFSSMTVNISGGDVGHGLGWLVLLLSLGVAVLPYLDIALEAHMCRRVNMLALGSGVVILLYLLAGNVRLLNAGIILAISGYVVEFAAVIRQAPVPVLAKE